MVKDRPVNIACVLRVGDGGDFGAHHVARLAKQVAENLTIPYTFYCLTNHQGDVGGVEMVRLQDGLKGWWSKLELFREFDSCFYLDLDTTIVGNIDNLVLDAVTPRPGGGLRVLPSLTRAGGIGSGVMAWERSHRFIYDIFIAERERYIRTCRTRDDWGDQGFIQNHCGITDFTFFDSKLVKSYKHHVQKQGVGDAKIVYFHGKPRPWDKEVRL